MSSTEPLPEHLPEPLPESGPLPLLLVINRYDDEFGEYHRFVPDGTHRLAYLATEDALAPLDRDTAVETVVVPDLTYATLLPHARRIAETHGPLAGIVGVSEFDLLTAAELRAALGIPGWSTAYVNRFRDKTVMKRWITYAGIRAPRYLELAADATADAVLAGGTGLRALPLILKPRDGAASKGVQLVRSEEELALALTRIGPEALAGYEAEEYVEGRIHHVDGIRSGGRFHFATVSEYVNTCLDFTDGTPLGSVLLDRGPLHDQLTGFAADCLDALELWDGPFHLELILTDAGEPVFLEVGLRPGGAGVPFVHRDLFGIDLYCEAFRTTIGLPPLTDAAQLRATEAAGGWVVFPEPRSLPARVTVRDSLVAVVPEVYAEALPEVGHVFDGDGGYDHAGGRFLLRGTGQAAVRRAVQEVIVRYRLLAEPAAAEVGA